MAVVACNEPFRERVAPRGTLHEHPEWGRLVAAMKDVGRSGVPAEVEFGDQGIPMRLHLAPVVGRSVGVDGVLAWVDGPQLADDEVRLAAERAITAKSKFLAAASHDLRQPFQAMRFFQSVLQGQVGDAKALRTVEMLGQALTSGEQLLNSLLDISTLDAGTLQAKAQRFSLDGLLEQLVHEFRPEAEEKGLQFRARIKPVEVWTDPMLLERVLRNLLSNAVRYTRRGGLLLAVRQRAGFARIEVWDTGVGIPEDQLAMVFEEFTQLENPERDRTRGLGLGLAIVRRLAHLLDVRVDVRSRLGRGSVFSLLVPRPDGEGPGAEVEPQRESTEMSSRTVLVVDDDAMVLMGLQMILESWGLIVLPAEDMAGVLQGLDQSSPDLVLTDLRLRGGLSGFDVVDRVRAMLRNDGLPAIVLTGETGEAELAEGRRRNVGFLHKPIQAEPLRDAIAQAMGDRLN